MFSCKSFAVAVWIIVSELVPAAAGALEISTKPVRTLERPEGDVFGVAFSADTKYIFAGGDRGVVYTWDTYTGEQVNRTTAHLRAAVFSVAAYPLAPFAVHASELGIKFHLMGERGRAPTFPFKHLHTVLTLDFSRDGDHMASADRGGEIIVWNLWTGEPYRRFQTGKEAVNSVRFHPDGNRIAAATNDGKVRVYDTKGDKLLYEIRAHDGPSYSVALSGDGRWLATAGKDKRIKLWNAQDGREYATLDGHGDAVNAVLFHPKGLPFLVSASDDKTVRLWNAGEKKALQTVAHDNAVNALSWRSDAAMLATGAGKLVRLYETK